MNFPLHFLRPWWWLALLPMPLALWAMARNGGGRAALTRLADAALLPYLLHDTGARRRVALGLATIAWLLAVAALAGPSWQRIETPLYVNGAARVVALSLSGDMLAQDLPPDRMTHARFAVRDLLDAAGDARTALVAYAGAAFTVAPLTRDKHTVLNLLRVLRPDVMPTPGNDAAAGIAQSLKLLRDAHVRGGEIILVTDTADAAAVHAARTAHAQGIRVDVLGVGTTRGAPVPKAGGGFASGPDGTLLARRDDAALRAVAQAGGGSYAVLPADGGQTPAFAAPVAIAGHASHGERAQIWRDGGVWLLPILVVLAALAFRRGWLLVFAVLVMPIAMPTAHAASWSSWWMNRDQRAAHALHDGNARRARELATSPGMRGAADYRAGDYAGAAKTFAQGHGARAHYNLGNALAKAGDYRKAIAAYDEALKLDPELADARANRDAVRKWLAQHARPPQNGSSPNHRKRQSGAAGRQGSSRQGSQSSTQTKQSASPSSSSGSNRHEANRDKSSNSGNAGKPDTGTGATGQAQASNMSPQNHSMQRDDAKQAAKALQQELARHAQQPSSSSQAFALGQDQSQPDGKFNAEQRALLRSVPDDPGALLRRKFRLEWQQRQTQGQDNQQ
ncbi:MAG: tetratricopeptide repeat protein [Rhodanobacteraceae bacterium]